MSAVDEHASSSRHARTIKREVGLEGLGLFTGEKVCLKLKPAEEGAGIFFTRTDLPGNPRLQASIDNVIDTPRCTILGCKEFQIQTVEHVLSAIKAYNIDNIEIEVNGSEVPSCDGSAFPFVELIENAGVVSQRGLKKVFHLDSPVFWTKGNVQLVALPSEEFRISYTLSYPNSDSDILKAQFYTIHLNEASYKEEIAKARTFSPYDEVVPLIEAGKIKGGRLDNAVIIKGNKILNPEGVRYEDEMVRHKILDLVGDLCLMQHCFLAHVIAIRSGHFSNTSFAKELINHFDMEMARHG
ncbi:UDP-3-O-[3-hydroxymyristoyl] N-acetylglucosamine deacetylase [Candidatus Aerophobetes bacterium]|uniref:UDP-3-O-acyl-N-acetylglucosamine deacetylase n=1 Tax=Aerophobetes bacterium TaxID=2030807 RepID=A0A2A4X8K0_UNCAE|nr:MAG: UDP-3-O-[3-hydroxymyristoyl] N-acetylglucosamine deacetylase [Candidatus Aerophobetes bacterium]